MKTSVNFQGPFSYNLGLIIFLTVFLFLFVIGAIVFNYKRKKIIEKPKELIKPKNLDDIKKDYLNKISLLEQKLENKQISNRKAYQNLSIIIRLFVFEATKINVQKCTLQEIKQYKFPVLTELVDEYYVPEFAKEEAEGINNSIEKTRKAIEKWS